MTNRELWDKWNRGDFQEVVDFLATAHPARTAVFIVQGAQDRVLTTTDCNLLTNRLMEKLIASQSD